MNSNKHYVYMVNVKTIAVFPFSKLENWKIGKLENWKIGKLENWKIGKLENWITIYIS